MSWRDLLNVQNVEKGFFRSSNSYGIPDIRKDEFEIKELIPYRVDKNRKGTAHFFLDDYRFERCWKWTSSQITATNGAERGQTVYAIKGGSWYANPNSCKITMSGEGRRPNTGYNTVGFRVVAVKK